MDLFMLISPNLEFQQMLKTVRIPLSTGLSLSPSSSPFQTEYNGLVPSCLFPRSEIGQVNKRDTAIYIITVCIVYTVIMVSSNL